MTKPCIDCGSTNSGPRWRRLCRNCYFRHRYHGTIDQYERPSWSNTELVAEWDWLRRQGYTRAQAAERLGMSKKRLEKAIERHQRRQMAEAS